METALIEILIDFDIKTSSEPQNPHRAGEREEGGVPHMGAWFRTVLRALQSNRLLFISLSIPISAHVSHTELNDPLTMLS